MTLHITDPRTNALAREIAHLAKKPVDEALRETLERRVNELKGARDGRASRVRADIRRIQDEIAVLPARDDRTTRQVQDELNADVLGDVNERP